MGLPRLNAKVATHSSRLFLSRPSLSLSPLLSFVFSLPHAATWFKRQGGYKLDTPMTMPSVPVRPMPRVISVLPDQWMLFVIVPMLGQGMAVPSASGGAIIAQQPSSYTLPEPAAEPLSGSAVDWLSADAAQELVPAVVALPGGRNVSTLLVAPPVDPLAGARAAVEDWTGFPAGTFREPRQILPPEMPVVGETVRFFMAGRRGFAHRIYTDFPYGRQLYPDEIWIDFNRPVRVGDVRISRHGRNTYVGVGFWATCPSNGRRFVWSNWSRNDSQWMCVMPFP